MCGRYARIGDLVEWVAPLGADPGRDLHVRLRETPSRYNIAPGTSNWILAMDERGDLAVEECKWAFPTRRGNRINVRSETAHVVPEYREHFARHRCVVPASGFYEPKGPKAQKNRPWFYFQRPDRAPLYLGAIVKPEGFSILTRAPAPPVSAVHDRTPVLVPADGVLEWLDPDLPGREALERFAPPEFGTALEGWQVGDGAKRPVNDEPGLIEPLPGGERLTAYGRDARENPTT